MLWKTVKYVLIFLAVIIGILISTAFVWLMTWWVGGGVCYIDCSYYTVYDAKIVANTVAYIYGVIAISFAYYAFREQTHKSMSSRMRNACFILSGALIIAGACIGFSHYTTYADYKAQLRHRYSSFNFKIYVNKHSMYSSNYSNSFNSLTSSSPYYETFYENKNGVIHIIGAKYTPNLSRVLGSPPCNIENSIFYIKANKETTSSQKNCAPYGTKNIYATSVSDINGIGIKTYTYYASYTIDGTLLIFSSDNIKSGKQFIDTVNECIDGLQALTDQDIQRQMKIL